MATIPASNPVVTDSTPGNTYNSWFVTQLVCKFTPTTAPTIVTLQRAVQNEDTSWTLMPRGPGASVTFNVDLFAQQANYPAFGTAMNSVIDAIVQFGTAKNLL